MTGADGIDDKALARFRLLRPILDSEATVAAVSRANGVPVPTLRRWLRLFRRHGMAGLQRRTRQDRGKRHKVTAELSAAIEGLALDRPRRSVASIHRAVRGLAAQRGEAPPSYATVYAVTRGIDPDLMMFAHDGTKAYEQTFELLHRREASQPNEIWQGDDTELDILVFDETGATVRPWLCVIIDDHSRVVAAYRLSPNAPSALQTALALRNAI
jgi:putative transposase